jgi:hypothetical protein
MNRLGIALIAGVFAVVSHQAAAEPACREVTVPASVETGREELTLADLLRGDCPPLREAAAQVGLGAAPRAGSVRVLEGRHIRGLLEELAGPGLSLKQIAGIEIPRRIAVRRAGGTKSCEEIARLVAKAAPARGVESALGWGRQNLDCAAARGIPEESPLELTKTVWNASLRRWEFSLRCVRAEDCVPFLVWAGEPRTSAAGAVRSPSGAAPGFTAYAGSSSSSSLSPSSSLSLLETNAAGAELLVKRGQTATLSWERGGIRVVLPVTCLDGGGLGQFVRVRFKNAPRVLTAEVVGEGMLRATL